MGVPATDVAAAVPLNVPSPCIGTAGDGSGAGAEPKPKLAPNETAGPAGSTSRVFTTTKPGGGAGSVGSADGARPVGPAGAARFRTRRAGALPVSGGCAFLRRAVLGGAGLSGGLRIEADRPRCATCAGQGRYAVRARPSSGNHSAAAACVGRHAAAVQQTPRAACVGPHTSNRRLTGGLPAPAVPTWAAHRSTAGTPPLMRRLASRAGPC